MCRLTLNVRQGQVGRVNLNSTQDSVIDLIAWVPWRVPECQSRYGWVFIAIGRAGGELGTVVEDLTGIRQIPVKKGVLEPSAVCPCDQGLCVPAVPLNILNAKEVHTLVRCNFALMCAVYGIRVGAIDRAG